MSGMQEPRGGARPGPVNHSVIMGVSGCGKTAAAVSLSRELGWPVADADDFHPAANIEKMSPGRR